MRTTHPRHHLRPVGQRAGRAGQKGRHIWGTGDPILDAREGRLLSLIMTICYSTSDIYNKLEHLLLVSFTAVRVSFEYRALRVLGTG